MFFVFIADDRALLPEIDLRVYTDEVEGVSAAEASRPLAVLV